MNKKYQIIYADPPWDFEGRKLNRITGGKEITDHYSIMTDNELLALPIKKIVHKNAWLFMWIVYAKLPFALKLMQCWGFKYSTVAFEWFKLTEKGKPVCFMGGTVCGGAIELCLLGKRGSLKRKTKHVRRLIISSRREHSQKPDGTRERILKLCGDLPRIELFARKEKWLFENKTYKGWDVWGNEIENDIEL